MTGPTTADRSSCVPESFHHDAPFCWVSSKEVLFCCHRSCCARLQRWETQRVLLSYTEKKRFGSGWRWQAFEFISISEKIQKIQWWNKRSALTKAVIQSLAEDRVFLMPFLNLWMPRKRDHWLMLLPLNLQTLATVEHEIRWIKWINVPGLIVQCIIPHA